MPDTGRLRAETETALEAAKAEQSPVGRFVFSLQALEDLPGQIEAAKTRWQEATGVAERAEEDYRVAADKKAHERKPKRS